MWEQEIKLLSDAFPSISSYSVSDFSYVFQLLAPQEDDSFFKKIKSLPPVVQQSKYLELTVKLQLLSDKFKILKADANLTSALLCGYPTVVMCEAATAAPYLFPFTQKKELLDRAELFTGMKSLSQLITGYQHSGVTQLIGDTLPDMERIIYSELSNFPLEGITIVIVRAVGEDFCCTLNNDGVYQYPLEELDSIDPIAPCLPIVVEVEQSSPVNLQDLFNMLEERIITVNSFILSPIASQLFTPYFNTRGDDLNTSFVIVNDNPSAAHLLFSEYTVLFRGIPDNSLREYGFIEIEDYRVVIYVEEEDSTRLFLAKAGSEPQLQIYPW